MTKKTPELPHLDSARYKRLEVILKDLLDINGVELHPDVSMDNSELTNEPIIWLATYSGKTNMPLLVAKHYVIGLATEWKHFKGVPEILDRLEQV